MDTTTFALRRSETGRKSAKYSYEVYNVESGEVKSKRGSNREYVACTADGEYFFGRLDLISKGDHGRRINTNMDMILNTKKCYQDFVKMMEQNSLQVLSFEDWADVEINRAQESLEALSTIAIMK